ncbi:MAG: (2Fe-2S)-binding protein [Bacteroidota bacterium]
MNSCCTLPVEVIAADEHKKGDECCLVTEHTPAPAKAECPVTKTMSRKVQRRTVEHLLKPQASQKLRDVQYYYCTDEACDVVYFSNEEAPTVSVGDVNVKVFTKDQGDDVNVCYCFTWTRGRIKNQIAELGKSTAAIEIAREVKAGRCECDVKNPKGECCLGDVNRVVREFQQRKEDAERNHS